MSRPSGTYFFAPDETIQGDQVQLLCDGREAFPAILGAIENAKKQIAFEIYMFSSDLIGLKVRDALIEAQKRGVMVRLMFDSIGSYPNDISFFEPLMRVGGKVVEYHPLKPWRYKWQLDHLSRRNHRKLLIVDDDRVIVGGLNVSDEYALEVKRGGVHDLAVEIVGRSAHHALKIFEGTWRSQTQELFSASSSISEATNSELSWVQMIGSDRYFDRWKLRRTLLYGISQAQSSIDLINPYFLPAPDVITAFRRAIKRGVRVRLLLPAFSDVWVVDLASNIVQRRLSKYGVEVYRWPGQVHAKCILIDRQWYSIGSYNFDYQSLFRNLEVVANIIHAQSANRLSEIFEKDVQNSRLWTPEDWKRKPWWMRLAARLLYRLRRFL